MAELLETRKWTIISASRATSQLARTFDFLRTIWRRRADYDVASLDVYSGRAFLLAELNSLLLRIVRKPFVINLHGGALRDFANRHPRRVKRLLAAASTVATPSLYIASGLGALGPEIQVVPNAIHIRRYPFRQRSHVTAKILWVRAFHRVYAPWLAPRVVGDLLRAGIDAHLIMIGPDKHDGSFDATIKEISRNNMTGNVEVVGPVQHDEIPRWLQQADIFLNTSTVDNFPISVLEAMACGLCPISTNVGGLPHLIRDGENGILVPVNDTQAMSQAIVALLRNAATGAGISLIARKTAEAYDWNATIKRWEQIFRELASSNS